MPSTFLERAKDVADRLRSAGHVHVVSHIDADGLASGAVATAALDRAGIENDVEFVKNLPDATVDRLADEGHELVWFVDLGSGVVPRCREVGLPHCIADHHVPTGGGAFHLNCHLHGYDGARWVSGAGTAYLVARALDPGNRDLAATAIVGAVGDLQDTDARRLVGMNRLLVDDATRAGVLEARTDTRYFGRETRPVTKLLQYADDPLIPGVTGRRDAATRFLDDLDVPLKDGDAWRRWVDLDEGERRRVLSAVARRLLDKGFGHRSVRRLTGEVYTFPKELEGEPVRDAKEFATLLNSCGRYGEYATGLAIARGDREDAYVKALGLLRGHRRNLVQGIQYVQQQGIEERDMLQTFHAGDAIPETIVGIVAGMLFNSEGVRRDLPMVAFAAAEEGKVKVSSRATRGLVDRGVDLSRCMREAAASVEGQGGGHAPAAGATIPSGREEEFLTAVESVLRSQLEPAP